MGKRIKKILWDFLKDFRWYLLFIPFILVIVIIGHISPVLGMLFSQAPLFIILFCGIPILLLGIIICFIKSRNDKNKRKH